ncbi:DUF2062 domain-containing protein [Solimonas soli]|uniref:DUF2062 domain-containing protein n=1 Tax=Solimonas soli TaxID=413479 RepID=UPI000483A426|nr:DUF2062 domain-containing protein [Solimonas soli]
MTRRARLLALLRQQLLQGVTPRRLALALGLAFALGIFPVLGATTMLCAVAGVLLRLNQPLLQLANYLVYPLQLALLLPFYRAGEWLFGMTPVPLLSVADLLRRFDADPWAFVADYARVGVAGIVVWLLLSPLLVGTLYGALLLPLRRIAGREVPA